MSAVQLHGVPIVETFQPRIVVLSETHDDQPQSHPFRSRWLNAEGIPTCPQCGCHEFSVRDSEPWKGGIKPRYRACCECGLPAKTGETFLE